jgi:hypothetical protein
VNWFLAFGLPAIALVLFSAPFIVAARMRRKNRARYIPGHPDVAAFAAGRAQVHHLNELTGESRWIDRDEKPADEHTPRHNPGVVPSSGSPNKEIIS